MEMDVGFIAMMEEEKRRKANKKLIEIQEEQEVEE